MNQRAMKILWCWRCRQDMPMLEDEEIPLIYQAIREGMPAVEAEAQRLGRQLLPEIPWKSIADNEAIAKRQRPMLEMYRLLTGFEVTVFNAVWHHFAHLYGPPCPQCHKPLRTPVARFCATCGFGQADMATDSRPLVERKPELFA